MIFREVDAPLTHDLRDGTLPALDAVRDAHTPVAATGEGKTGDLDTVILDQFDTVKVPECVLGHAKVPAKHTREERLRKRVETQDVTELGKYRLDEFLVRAFQNLLIVRTSDETTQ